MIGVAALSLAESEVDQEHVAASEETALISKPNVKIVTQEIAQQNVSHLWSFIVFNRFN